MKKRNLAIHTVIASAMMVLAGSAAAGVLSTANTILAVENFGSTYSSTASITPGAVSYNMSAATNVNAGATIYFVIRLTGATFAAAPAIATIQFAGAVVAAAPTGATPGAVNTVSADGTTLQVAITNGNTVANLGLGALTYTPAGGNLVGVGGLGTPGSTISATVSVTTIAATGTTALNSTNALAPTVDAPLPTAAMATSARAINSVLDSSMNGYAGRIDLTAVPISSGYRNAATNVVLSSVALGSVNFSNVAGTQGQATTPANDYTVIAGSANSVPTDARIVVTPGTGQTFPIGATLSADITSSACGALIGTPTTPFTATTNTLPTTITVAQPNVASNTPIFVCMSAPSATNVASPMTPTVTGTIRAAVATDANPTVTGTGFALTFNGSQRDVRSYIPASVIGYTSFVRVINGGTVAAAVSGQWVYENGTTSTANVIIGSHPAGGSITLTSTQIEASLGAPAAIGNNRPRLRVTAPTNSMDVQSFFLTNASGNFSDATGAQ